MSKYNKMRYRPKFTNAKDIEDTLVKYFEESAKKVAPIRDLKERIDKNVYIDTEIIKKNNEITKDKLTKEQKAVMQSLFKEDLLKKVKEMVEVAYKHDNFDYVKIFDGSTVLEVRTRSGDVSLFDFELDKESFREAIKSIRKILWELR